MKPKNRVMCPDCGRLKMFFESESKANNFIKFNKDDIENGDELRSYYCPACCGWHISHKQYKQTLDRYETLAVHIFHLLMHKFPNHFYPCLLIVCLIHLMKLIQITILKCFQYIHIIF